VHWVAECGSGLPFYAGKKETTAKNIEQVMKDIYDKIGLNIIHM
jgi:hypothetical protein